MTINLPVPAAPGGPLATVGAPALRPLLAHLREGPHAIPRDALATLAARLAGHADADEGPRPAAGRADRARFLTDVRRLWMH